MYELIRCRALVVLLLSIGWGTAQAASGQSSVILHHEPLYVVAISGEDGAGILRLKAFGRIMTARVSPNEGLGERQPEVDYRLLRGELEGIPGSWLRLMQQGEALSGIVYDGVEILGIEPRASAAPRLQHPDTDPDTTNVIFRMSDLVLPAGTAGCDLVPTDFETSGAEALDGVVDELAPAAHLAADGGRRMRLHVVADYEFFQLFGSASEAEILARLNIVDGIYTNQLNIDIEVDRLQIYGSANDPFTTDEPSALLEELSNYRLATGYSAGPTHLLTGRNLAGTTRGIAYLGAACSAQFGAALSQQITDPWIGALTTAHEIGHTLGAWHDNEASQDPDQQNPCRFAPPGFLMERTINGNDQFSQCSLDTIDRFLASGAPQAACVSGTTVNSEAGEDVDSGGGGSLGLATVLALALLRAATLRRHRSSAFNRDRVP